MGDPRGGRSVPAHAALALALALAMAMASLLVTSTPSRAAPAGALPGSPREPGVQPATRPAPATRPGASRATPSTPAARQPLPRARPKPWAVGVSPKKRARALRLYRIGNKYFEDSQYAKALTHYLRAIRSWDHPAIRFNIAVCYVHLTHPLEAYRNMRLALRHGRAPLKAHYKPARTYLRLLRSQLAALTVRCDTPGARVTLDGRYLFTGPGKGSWTVQVGKHALVASLRGHLTETRSIALLPRQRLRVRLAPLPIGKAVRVERRWKVWIPWTVLGLGVVLSAVGATLTGLSVKSFHQYDSDHFAQCPTGCDVRPAELVELQDRAKLQRNLGVPLLSVGSAALVTGVVLLLLNRVKKLRSVKGANKSTSKLFFRPHLAPGHAALTAGFLF